jgi:hypothetical protein
MLLQDMFIKVRTEDTPLKEILPSQSWLTNTIKTCSMWVNETWYKHSSQSSVQNVHVDN